MEYSNGPNLYEYTRHYKKKYGKCLNEEAVQKLVKQKGFYKAYHMNKKSWITIVLNDTLDDSMIKKLIDESYNIINDVRG